MQTITRSILKKVYPPRPPETKKYDYGLMIVIGGGEFYSGAPALAALAGFRAGLDMVRVIAPRRAADIIASFSPILAAYPLDDTHLLGKHLPLLLSMTAAAKEVSHGKVSVVIGSGLGRSEETQKTVLEYLSQVDDTVAVVIDADAIHAIAKNPAVISQRQFVVTPNRFEFTLLTKREIQNVAPADRIPIVQEEAARLQTTLVLKAKVDIISNGKEVLLNGTGSPYMSVGGTGDTLAGIIGAILARDIDPCTAAAAGAYINGKAGETAAAKFKDSLVATDLIDEIPEVIQ